ncbi:hypothetical protein ACFQ9X_12215 [Catenulispora yoronensis]
MRQRATARSGRGQVYQSAASTACSTTRPETWAARPTRAAAARAATSRTIWPVPLATAGFLAAAVIRRCRRPTSRACACPSVVATPIAAR